MAHLGQVSELVGVQQQFLQTPSVAVDLIGHVEQRAVAFIDHLDMTVAPPQGYTVKHHGGVVVADKSAPRAINKQPTGGRSGGGGGGGCNRLLWRDGPDGGEHERGETPQAARHRNCRVKVSCGNVTEQMLLPSRRPWELLSVFASLWLVCRHLFPPPRLIPRVRWSAAAFKLSFRRVNTGYISMGKGVAFLGFLSLSCCLSSRS